MKVRRRTDARQLKKQYDRQPAAESGKQRKEGGCSMAFHIFFRDLGRIIKNPIALIVSLGVAMIPSLYAWVNIIANRDPYSNTAGVSVAVVNNDAGADSPAAGHVDAGSRIEDELRNNTQLGWTFVGEETARDGVKSGKYYAAIIFGQDFSEKMISLLSGNPQKPEITYLINEKKNAIASKITDTGASSIEEKINSAFVGAVAKVVVEKAAEASDGIGNKIESRKNSLSANIAQTAEKVGRARSVASGVRADLAKSQQALSEAKNTINLLEAKSDSVRSQAGQIGRAINAIQEDARALDGIISARADSLSAGLDEIENSVGSTAGEVIERLEKGRSLANDFGVSLTNITDANSEIIGKIRAFAALDPSLYGLLKPTVDRLEELNSAAKERIGALNDDTGRAIGFGAESAGNLASFFKASASGAKNAANGLKSGFSQSFAPAIKTSLQSASTLVSALDSSLASAKLLGSQASELLDGIIGVFAESDDILGRSESTLSSVENRLNSVSTDLEALDSAAVIDALKNSFPDTRSDSGLESIASFISAPVETETTAVYPVKDYGSAVAPFYINLALWVGGFALIAIFKVEVDRENLEKSSSAFTSASGSSVKPAQAYFGRGLLFVFMAILQALIVSTGTLFLGIQCEKPVLFVLSGVWIGIVYASIVYSLAAAFKHVGKAVGVILIILQIPAAAGTYPIELMPPIYRRAEAFLPFYYGINALRETIGGLYGSEFIKNNCMLLCFVAASLFVGLCLRSCLKGIIALFDKSLGKTDLLVYEEEEQIGENEKIEESGVSDSAGKTAVKTAAKTLTGRKKLAIIGIPSFALILLLLCGHMIEKTDINAKIIYLLLWIAVIIATDACIIFKECKDEKNNLSAQPAKFEFGGKENKIDRKEAKKA